MQIEYTITTGDLATARAEMRLGVRQMRILVRGLVILLAFVVLFGAVFLLDDLGRVNFTRVFALAAAFVLIGLFGDRLFMAKPFRRFASRLGETAIRRTNALGYNRTALGQHTMRITENGVEIIAELIEIRLSWRAVLRVASNDDYIFIVVNPLVAYTVPKRAFASASDAGLFLDAATDYYERLGEES